MARQTHPVLSIGIIFKNEIRCLERCLKSLQGLREAVPCELVMADTGSGDGSREIAARYADVLFDFPWINDFAAARNAVMDRSSGVWFLSLDADEWMDGDVADLVRFLTTSASNDWDVCALTERNYHTYDFTRDYGVFTPWRLLRMSTGVRYQGAIHETWRMDGLRPLVLEKVVIHHDGYVSADQARVEEKRRRNMPLLREKCRQNPNDLLTLLQMIESGQEEPDYYEFLRHAVELVETREPAEWKILGPTIYRYAINSGKKQELPEMERWLQEAEDWFSDSYFILLDASINAVAYYMERERFDDAIRWGERGLRGYEDFYAGRGDLKCQMYGALQSTDPSAAEALKIVLVRSYFGAERWERGMELLAGMKFALLNTQWTRNLMETLHMVHFRSRRDTAPLIRAVWEGLNEPLPDKQAARARRAVFLETGALSFAESYRSAEDQDETFCRRGYTLYQPLAGTCTLGTAAAILCAEGAEEMAALLRTVENWEELPTVALIHALHSGVAFPLPDKPLMLEEMDLLAGRLAQDREELLRLIGSIDEIGTLQMLTWARGLYLNAVRSFDWEEAADGTKGLSLARCFAAVERKYLSLCYTPELLRAENLFALPVMHRFGWHCGRAFAALDGGDSLGYVRCLREGLDTCRGMKDMVEFLMRHTPELQPPPELLALANQVRTLMAQYDAGDPAVAALKRSEAYQRVAYLLDEQ